jgi:hypothetical protein
MPEPYNLSAFTNARDLLDAGKATDTILGQSYVFGTFILLIIAIVSFLVMRQKGYHPAACFSVSTWICMLLSWILRSLSLIGNEMMWGATILAAVATLILFLSNNPD